MRAIADTGLLVALLNKRDRHHQWAAEIVREYQRPLLTCEPVLTEVCYFLQRSEPVIGLLRGGGLHVDFEVKEELEALERLGSAFSDRTPDLADMCVVRMSELFPNHKVLTADRRDFTVYRRFERKPIPAIFPPE
jgi:predicted nucleic acid-binding protein